ncbi:class I SAM-dependent methyltransferase [Kitasatospora kifunensis]|uniref:SAM-dependent methyltransferase n=1 Tax=Kitasatospora kifunensis TaxID=58351 RepID=A0A7W7QXL2_KITKI|nr:class I SAM-dependent methyltransferase [Kitasatospora kifunensis]MBB4921579.1 SAM-dependent methyltransferase [Kitasatospora kifunensis]
MMTAEESTPRAQYDAIAQRYDRHSAVSPFNTLLERPAMLAACPPLAGRRVLEVGCAGGRLTELLLERGARVVGFDASAAMVEIARNRVGDAAQLHVHDLREPLDFASDASFDVVVVSLCLHYLRDWASALTELRRVLVPGGVILVSTGHPMSELHLSPSGDYHAVEEVHDEWPTVEGPPLAVSFFRRPLSSSLQSAQQAGLVLHSLIEPRPDPAHREAFGKHFDMASTQPVFMLLVLGRPLDGTA